MRWNAAIAVVVLLGGSIVAEEASDLCDTEQRLLSIELESYFDAYKSVSASLRSIETEIVLMENAESKLRLEQRGAQLRSHLGRLEDRVRETSARMREAATASSKHGERQDVVPLKNHRTRLQSTERELDIAIQGPGFFRAVNLDTGRMVYTRRGSLDIGADGHLFIGRSRHRLLLIPAIQIPEEAVSVVVSRSGAVQVRIPGTVELRNVGQLQLSTFANPDELREVDEHHFTETNASGAAKITSPGLDVAGLICQNCLEVSGNDEVRDLIQNLAELLSDPSAR